MITSPLYDWGVFSIAEGLLGGQVWRFLTFQFLHVSFVHLFFNMYALFLFGPYVERYWRSRPFLGFYLISGLAGALFYALMVFIDILPGDLLGTNLLGASAGVFAVLIGTAIISPEGRIMLLIPPIPMKMRTFALVMLGLEVILLLTNSSNAGGSAGHLGGALMGFLFFKIPGLGNLLHKLEPGVSVVSPKRRPGRPGAGKKSFRVRHNYEPKLRPRSKVNEHSSEIDRILDKINEEGLHSLTDEERQILQKAAKR
jgi:membrane associated rhomboid family serine protease